MNSFLDWLDEAAGGLIRFAYLAAGITAVAVYFGAGAMPHWADGLLNAALPWTLAFALETHTYLTSRRVRAAWQEHDVAALKVNSVVLLVLLAFSGWNQLGYLSGTWQPPHAGPLALPTWLAYGVRALIVPVAFMAAAFLAPLAPPITMQIENEARNVLADVFKIAKKQRRKLLQEAQTTGRDLTGALVELVADDETRRIIAHAYHAIGAGEQSSLTENISDVSAERAIEQVRRDLQLTDYPPAIADLEADAGDTPPESPEPPDGGGSPALASKPSAGNVTPLRRTRREASRANARSGRRGTAERRVRAALVSDPAISHAGLVRRTRLSSSTISKWLRVIEAERAAEQPGAGRAG